jgi:hypothetical protein
LLAFREVARGLRLLRDRPSPSQREQYDLEGYLEVIGSDTGRTYRIHQGTAMNMHELDPRNRLIAGWCFAPCGSLVVGDVMLAQKIALETFARGALSVARRFARNGGLTATSDLSLVPWGS